MPVLHKADFTGATFSGPASFDHMTCMATSSFFGATFTENADFSGVTFRNQVGFFGTTFRGRLLRGSDILRARLVSRSDVRARRRLPRRWIQVAQTFGPLHVSDRLWLDGAVFTERVGIEASARRASFARAVFGSCVLSLRDARVGQLSLAGVDLRRCRFARAHGLDDLAYERAEFAEPPPGWRWIRWRPVRWTRRRTIAEEHQWRAARTEKYGSGWSVE